MCISPGESNHLFDPLMMGYVARLYLEYGDLPRDACFDKEATGFLKGYDNGFDQGI